MIDVGWMAQPLAGFLVFEIVSTVVQTLSFGALLLRQQSSFTRQIAALEITHKAQRLQDKAEFRRETNKLKDTIGALVDAMREVKPDVVIPMTASYAAVDADAIKAMREFARQNYSGEEWALVMADFGVSDEHPNEATIAKMDRTIRRLAKAGRMDDLRERVIEDRPAAALALGADL